MVDAGRKEHFRQRGVPLIPLDAGARQFVREVTAASPDVELLVSGAATPAPLPAGGPHQSVLEFHVSAASHPFLDGHRVQGTPVVPVVLALEWMARAAAAHRPELLLTEIAQLRVQRGIRLLRFEEGGESVSVRCREAVANGAPARLFLEIRGEDAALHYSAEAVMAEAFPTSAESGAASPIPTAPPPAAGLYGSLLFHGESFQVIRSLVGLDARAGEVRVAGVREQGWSGGPWHIDAAALDGGLQLAILLGHRTLGEPSLPTGIGRLRLFQAGSSAGEVRCRIEAKASSPLRLLADLVFDDAQGRRLAEMSDVEMHALPEHAPAGEPERAQPALS
jgi:hypothetical protein